MTHEAARQAVAPLLAGLVVLLASCEHRVDCSDVDDLTVSLAVLPQFGSEGRFNFGDMYKDAATLGGRIRGDIRYQSTIMKIGDRVGILHYGIGFDASEMDAVDHFVACYEQSQAGQTDRPVELAQPIEPDTLLVREVDGRLAPVGRYTIVDDPETLLNQLRQRITLRKTYDRFCAECHGADGLGNTTMGRIRNAPSLVSADLDTAAVTRAVRRVDELHSDHRKASEGLDDETLGDLANFVAGEFMPRPHVD